MGQLPSSFTAPLREAGRHHLSPVVGNYRRLLPCHPPALPGSSIRLPTTQLEPSRWGDLLANAPTKALWARTASNQPPALHGPFALAIQVPFIARQAACPFTRGIWSIAGDGEGWT